MNNQNQIESKSYSLSVKSLVAWVVGLGTALVGVILVFSHFLSGVVVLIASSILIPPVYSLIKVKINLSLSKSARVFFYILFMVIGLTGLVSSGDKPVVTDISPEVKMVFDIPSLIGKNLRQLRADLGAPSYDTEPTPLQLKNSGTWEKTWSREGYSLMITYNTKTNKILDYFLGSETNDHYILFKNTNNILKVGNLTPSTSDYSINFVEAVNGSGYTGVVVTPR